MRRSITCCLLLTVIACGQGAGEAGPRTGPSSASPTSAAPTPSPTTIGPTAPIVGLPSEVIAKITIGGQPCGVLSAFGSMWVTDAQAAELVQVDLRTNRVVGRAPVDDTPCELTSAFGSLWVATQSGTLDRVDPRTRRVVARIPVGMTSYEPLVAFGSVWVSNRGSGTVSRVDPGRNRVVKTLQLPTILPGGLVEAAGKLWVGNDTAGDTKVVRVDPKTYRVETFKGGHRPAFVTAAAGSVWTADEDDGTVTRLDARTGAVRGSSVAGVRPVNLVALPGQTPEVWVPDDQGNLLIRIDALTGTVLERMLVGRGPAVAAVHGAEVWVSNFEDGTVWRVRPGQRV
jgi:streptogramin lyase